MLARLGAVPVLDLRSRQPSLEEIFRNCSVTPTARSLGGPFAWRSTEGTLAAWLTGILAYAVTIGVLLSTVTDFLARDPSHRQMLQTLGMDVAETTDGYLGVIAVLLRLVIAPTRPAGSARPAARRRPGGWSGCVPDHFPVGFGSPATSCSRR